MLISRGVPKTRRERDTLRACMYLRIAICARCSGSKQGLDEQVLVRLPTLRHGQHTHMAMVVPRLRPRLRILAIPRLRRRCRPRAAGGKRVAVFPACCGEAGVGTYIRSERWRWKRGLHFDRTMGEKDKQLSHI